MGPVCLPHLCIQGAYDSVWHIEGAQFFFKKKKVFCEELRNLRRTGGNCALNIKTRPTHCYVLTCCSLVFKRVTVIACRGSADLATPKGMTRTPVSVNQGWHCVSVGSKLLAKYDLCEENPRYPNTCPIHSLQLSARYWAFSGLPSYTTADSVCFLNLTGEGWGGGLLPSSG